MLRQFAKLLGLPVHQAEDALYSERSARAVLSRRSLFAAAGALAAGTAFSFPVPRRPPTILHASTFAGSTIIMPDTVPSGLIVATADEVPPGVDWEPVSDASARYNGEPIDCHFWIRPEPGSSTYEPLFVVRPA